MAKLLLEQWNEMAMLAGYNSRELAKAWNVTARTLQRRFHQQFGRSPQKVLDEARIAVAQRRLLQGDAMKAIATELGFKQLSHFCRKFKEVTGQTPTSFLHASLQRQAQMSL